MSEDDEFKCARCGSVLDSEEQLRVHLESAHEPLDRAHTEAGVDEASRQSFPASDAPSTTPVQGTGAPHNDDD